MALSPEQREYVIRSVVRTLKDVNRDDIIAALRQDVLATAEEDEGDDLELGMVVLAVAQATPPDEPAGGDPTRGRG
jgi:hypothetical protein